MQLGGNKGAVGSRNNYVVFLVKEADNQREGGGMGMGLGIEEEEDDNVGVLLYDPRKAKMCVRVGEEDAWSKPVSSRGVRGTRLG